VNERLEQRQSILVADQVSKTLGHQLVLRDVDLAVRKGECFGIIGPNGSGQVLRGR